MGRLPSSKSECGALGHQRSTGAATHSHRHRVPRLRDIWGPRFWPPSVTPNPPPPWAQSGACGQNRCASDENQFETEEGLQHPGRNAAARPFVPTRAGAGFLVQRTARKTARSFAIRTNQSAVDRAGIGSRIGQVRCQLAPPAAVEWDSLRCIEAIALSVEVYRHRLGL